MPPFPWKLQGQLWLAHVHILWIARRSMRDRFYLTTAGRGPTN